MKLKLEKIHVVELPAISEDDIEVDRDALEQEYAMKVLNNWVKACCWVFPAAYVSEMLIAAETKLRDRGL